MLMFVLMLINVNAGTTVLNSCGKNSGWLDNETYILNFTEIPSVYANTYCFQFDSDLNNIKFQGISPINIKKTTSSIIFFQALNPYDNTNLILENITINRDYNTFSFYMFYLNNGNYNYSGMNIDNVKINLTNSITTNNYFLFTKLDGSNTNWQIYLNDITINNLYVNNMNFLDGYIRNSGISGGSFNNYLHMNRLNMDNIFFNKGNHIHNFIYVQGINSGRSDHRTRFYHENNLISNLVLLDNDPIYANPTSGYYTLISSNNTITASTLKGDILTDVNDDNLAEDVPRSDDASYSIENGLIYVDLFNYRFLQDYTEGEPFFNIQGKTALVPINNNTIGSPLTITLQSTLDSSFMETNFTNLNGFLLVNKKIDCSIMSAELCSFVNDPTTTTSTGNLFASYIATQSNTLVNNAKFNIIHDGSGSVSASILANFVDVAYSNINVTNNNLTSSGNILTTGAETTSRQFIKLKGTSININNNNFEYTFPTIAGVGEFLYIESTNDESNTVTLNRFENTVTTPTTKSEVAQYKLKTNFYNNYLSNNVVLSTSSTTGVNVTPYIGFEHTDGKIYYYNIGNYYQENTGCVDSDVDGFCDSSYTSGSVTDLKPLASYPFDFTAHLLTADAVADNNAFNITLQTPTNGSIINLSGTTSPLNFSFSHDSDFPDLTCDYIIDGVIEYTIENTQKTIIHIASFMGWTEKSYTYRVNCYNGFQNINSDEITFTIAFITTPPTDGGNGDGITVSVDDIGFTGLFTGTPDDASDNVQGLFSIFETPMAYLYLLGFILIFIAMLSLVFAGIGAIFN